MIFSARSAPDRDAVVLRSVRQALNMPVVAISELPVGPASAAIAVHGDAREGGPHWTLAVRSERTRGVVFYVAQEAEPPTGSIQASGALLSLAEGMGFLFDEDWVDAEASETQNAAQRVWEAFASGAHSSALRPTRTTSFTGAASQRSAPCEPESLLTKFLRALPWNTQAAKQATVSAEERFDPSAAELAASEPGSADQLKDLAPQLAHRGDG
jgi:hypothetical protein